MDGQARTISARELYAHLGTAGAPAVVDVRKRDDFDADDRLIVSAVRYDTDANRRLASAESAGAQESQRPD
jgi:hypothetical protein